MRGTAPGLAADQFGATAHRIGAGVKAAAHALHYGAGVPVRKLPMVLKELTGITLTQSAMTQDALRRGEAEVGAHYRELCGGLRESAVINTDDTGWRAVRRKPLTSDATINSRYLVRDAGGTARTPGSSAARGARLSATAGVAG